MENKIACNSGRLKIIDPNDFGGSSPTNNHPVNNEDLNISVVLTTYKKGRTLLTTEKEGGIAESSRTVSINFIDGSNINGKKVLTTNYTDLTTIFDDNTTNNAGEALGMTNIDIDFNSQQSPIITINFIDVRGSAIFQNEANITEAKNKYSTFFQLPYPLFKLTIKGYYGVPVQYCLHMYKFNSKFNSQTGNFEITANFIGFTYAMLSDMLIGYLKAIPYTAIGIERYKEVNKFRTETLGLEPIDDLNTLMIKISEINNEIEKITAEDPDSKEIDNITIQNEKLDAITDIVLKLTGDLDSRGNNGEKYDYIVKTNLPGVDSNPIIKKYISDVNTAINEFNSGGLTALNIPLFQLQHNIIGNSKKGLKEIIDSLPDKTNTRGYLVLKYLDNINSVLPLTEDALFDIFDLTDVYNEINRARISLDNNKKLAQQSLGESIRDKIRDKLKFNPTVRNIMEVFTTAVEVFMETIYKVSEAAETDDGNKRKEQLKTKFLAKENSDLPDITQFLPWPDYREKISVDNRAAYTEKYLGALGVLQRPSDVHELAFIDDLLNAFLRAHDATDEANANLNDSQENWYPVNPVDTRLYDIDKQPYNRIEGISVDEVTRLAAIRAMTFMGYSNNFLTDEEITQMGLIEGRSIADNLAGGTENKVKLALSLLSPSDWQGKGKINNVERPVITNFSDYWVYYYINYGNFTNLPVVIPIDNSFDGEWPNVSGLKDKANETKFLTNYWKIGGQKTDDGGIYVKIFTQSEYDNLDLQKPLPDYSADSKTNTIILEKIASKTPLNNPQLVKDAGFNVFGGVYGIQEYNKLDWGNEELKDLDLMYVFYKDTEYLSALSYNRKNSAYGYPSNYDLRLPYFNAITDVDFVEDSHTNNEYHKNLGENRVLFNNLNVIKDVNVVYPFVTQTIKIITRNSNASSLNYLGTSGDEINNMYYSLFGCEWFYAQSLSKYPMHAKALLFLNTIPFNDINFEKNEIKHLFDTRAGFIHAPKTWVAYIGGLLWRADSSGVSDPIIFSGKSADGSVIHFLPYRTSTLSRKIYPKKNEHINNLYMDGVNKYTKISNLILNMPDQAKNEFKRVFFEFVENEWVSINNRASIIADGSINTFRTSLNNVYNYIKNGSKLTLDKMTSFGFVNDYYYNIMTPIVSDDIDDVIKHNSKMSKSIYLEFNTEATGNNVSKEILNLINQKVIIGNSGYRIWAPTEDPTLSEYTISTGMTNYHVVAATENDIFSLYFKKLIEGLKMTTSTKALNEEKKKIEQEVFGSTDETAIKLQLYRTCKNIYDKWIGGSTSVNDIIFQCGNTRNSVDIALKEKYRPGDKVRLIDSFRFVDRSFTDIGDKFYINPIPVNDYLMNSPNTSMFDAVSQLLASNNFTFIPLPTFINYNDPETLSSMFDTNPNYEKALKEGVCGPSFVAVYAGQSSKHLDFSDSEYPNDGIDFQCNSNKINSTNIPDDFIGTSNDFENDIAVFSVNYGQQNQNIFKDITLDQSEFSETDESLKISDDIAHKGANNNITLGGQNIYNVYSVRSYKAEVEMMGNPMIQPMMHFQLNNIPMFHGAYLITRVKHSIKANFMSTVFSGSRVRYPKTELLSGSDFYMSLLDSLNLSNGSGAGNGVSTSAGVPPIVNTIRENGGVPSNIISDQITMTPIPVIAGIRSQIATNKGKNRLITEAIKPLEEMLLAWVGWMKTEGFTGFKYPDDDKTYYAQITSAFRSYEDQANAGKNKAPGISNHQWGIAIDFKMAQKDGSQVPTEQNLKWFKIENNPALEWLLANSWKYGFVTPYGMRDGKGNYNEYWHYEYHGTAAKCLIENNPITYGGYETKNITNQKPIVQNPKTKGGKSAVYNDCSYVYIKNDQGTTDEGEQVATKLIYEELKKQLGYGDAAIAGIMGSLYQESRFIPAAINKSADPGAFGLAQWKSSRKTNLLKYIKDNNVSPIQYIQQIQFLKHELNTIYKYTDAAMKKETDVSKAAEIWVITFELTNLGEIGWSSSSVNYNKNINEESVPKRIAFAKQFSSMIKTKKFSFPR